MQAVETESIGNSRVGSTNHFDASKCKGWEKKKAKNVTATVTPVPIDDLCPVVFRLTFLPAI